MSSTKGSEVGKVRILSAHRCFPPIVSRVILFVHAAHVPCLRFAILCLPAWALLPLYLGTYLGSEGRRFPRRAECTCHLPSACRYLPPASTNQLWIDTTCPDNSCLAWMFIQYRPAYTDTLFRPPLGNSAFP